MFVCKKTQTQIQIQMLTMHLLKLCNIHRGWHSCSPIMPSIFFRCMLIIHIVSTLQRCQWSDCPPSAADHLSTHSPQQAWSPLSSRSNCECAHSLLILYTLLSDEGVTVLVLTLACNPGFCPRAPSGCSHVAEDLTRVKVLIDPNTIWISTKTQFLGWFQDSCE